VTEKRVETWMPLLVDKYLGDTTHLTTEQHGAYLLLLLSCWKRDGRLPADDIQLANIAHLPLAKWRQHGPILLEFFDHEDGYLTQKRLTAELARAKANVEQRSQAGKASAEKRKLAREGNDRSTAVGTSDATEGQREAQRNRKPIPIPSSPTSKKVSKASPSHPPGGGRFPEFWQAWPNNERKQDKKACLARWVRDGLDELADTILADVRTKRGTRKWQDGFIEAPLVYLNNRRWEDGSDEGAEPLEAWHETAKGVIAKGIELGVGEWSEALWAAGKAPDYLTYRARVFKAAGHSPRAAA